MGALHPAVLVGHSLVVAAVGQAVVAAEGVIPAGDVGIETPVPVPAGGRQPIRAQFPRHPTAGDQGILQPF